MLTAVERKSSRVVTVRGEQATLMLFYCFWQTKLWPDWMLYNKLGQPGDSATRHHLSAITSIMTSGALTFDMHSKEYREAYEFALEKCEQLKLTLL